MKEKKIQIKGKKLIPMLILSLVVLLGLWGALRFYSLNLDPNPGYDLLINLVADALFVLFSLVLIDRLRQAIKSNEWRDTRRFFFRMTILALNGFILEILEVFDPSGSKERKKWKEQGYWSQRLSKFLDLGEDAISERYRKLTTEDKNKVMLSFIKLRKDLYEVTTLFGAKFDDPNLFRNLSCLLAFTRDASEFVVRTKGFESFLEEGVPLHIFTLLLAVKQLYGFLKEAGASEHLLL